MLRLVEIGLFLSPFVIFVLWRVAGTEGGPSVPMVAAAAFVLALLAGSLVWLSLHQALPPGTVYEPARLEDGRIVAGHAVPR
jgi:hypothetical protein